MTSKEYALKRMLDLAKQGFMKPPSRHRVKAPLPIVSCDDCLNWHPKGKHTADAATRKANRVANKESAERIATVRAVADVNLLLRK